MNRHLLYHLYPRAGNGVWQANVAELLKRIDLFDGERVCTIATDERTDSAITVMRAFGRSRFDFIVHPNVTTRPGANPGEPSLNSFGEVARFTEKLKSIADKPGVTFSAHGKAVTHGLDSAPWKWAEAMYRICLDDWPAVETALQSNVFAGPLKMPFGRNRHGWHFAGSFFWFRNADVFAHPRWADVANRYDGVELWPGGLFPSSAAASLFNAPLDRQLPLHDPAYWSEVVEPRLQGHADGRERLTVYTAIFGRYDRLSEPVGPRTEDFVCYTDQEPEVIGWFPGSVWTIARVESLPVPNDPLWSARWFKMHPPSGDSLWIDGTVKLLVDPNELRIGSFATFRHPERDCVYAEIPEAAMRVARAGRPELAAAVLEYGNRCIANAVPARNGLWETGVVFRTEAARAVSEAWWDEMRSNGVPRDQVALALVAWRDSVEISELPRGAVEIGGHR